MSILRQLRCIWAEVLCANIGNGEVIGEVEGDPARFWPFQPLEPVSEKVWEHLLGLVGLEPASEKVWEHSSGLVGVLKKKGGS